MKKLLAFFLLLSTPCFAQQAILPCYQVSGSPCQIVNSTHPLPAAVYTNANSGFVLTSNGSGAATFQASGGGGSSAITIGSTVISGGTSTRVLFDNAGVAGEYVISGTGNVAMTTNAVFTTPNLGTPSAAILTNATGTAAALTAGTVTTNANLTGVITSSGNATSIASQTGTGTRFVVDTSPTIITPTITTSETNPLLIGGTTASSTLTLESTSGSGTTDAIIFKTASQAEAARITTGGGLGIGTNVLGTNAKVSINGGLVIGTYAGNATAGFSNGIVTSGNVAIGTSSIGFSTDGVQSLGLYGGNGINTYSQFYIGGNETGTNNASGLFAFVNTAIPSSEQRLGYVTGFTDGAVNSGKLIFELNNAGTLLEGMRITHTGAVGIGTIIPLNSAKLHVNGTIETGLVGSTTGSVLLAGSTSGLITEQPQAAAGTYNWNLPITAGASGQALLSAGGGSTAMTWATVTTGSGGTPTCGTGCASITAGSTDLRGSMVSGSSVSSVTLNFSGTLASAPFCTISDSNTTATADISSISTSALTVSLASALTSVTIYWNCPL